MMLLKRRFATAFLAVFLIFCASGSLRADARTLTACVPQKSWMVVGIDFPPLRDNDIYLSLENKGQIWSPDRDSELNEYFRLLHIEPHKDMRAFLYARYLNPYGMRGRLRVMEVNQDLEPGLQDKERATEYLNMRVALVTPTAAVFGTLGEVKEAIDVFHGKLPSLNRNAVMDGLLQKVPAKAAAWGIALPFTREEAARLHVEQETHPILEAFENYYFYGIPSNKTVDSHFFGQATSEGQATFVSTFILGTLTFARFKVDDKVADSLDNIDVRRNGKTIHVSAVVTRGLVDAYLAGDLGVK
jgi:hypothetical protein